MARDNSPKIRQLRRLERKESNREPYDRILIVSEGSKTEPNYFKEIVQTFRLNTANVHIYPSKIGTNPLKVIEYCEQLFEEGDNHLGIRKKSFDKIFAVFDRDDFKDFNSAILKAEALRLENDSGEIVFLNVIPSNPCFEIWLLLHFEKILHWIDRKEAYVRLKEKYPSYEKGATDVYSKTNKFYDAALKHSNLLIKRNKILGKNELYTKVGELVEVLINLKGYVKR
jgi:hypothetical protein